MKTRRKKSDSRQRLFAGGYVRIFFISLTGYISSFPALGQQKSIDSLERIIQQNHRDTTQVKVMNWLATELTRKDIRKAKVVLFDALNLARAIHFSKGIATCYTQLTIACSKVGETDSSHFYLNLLKDLSAKNPQTTIESDYYFTAGLIYKNEGKFREALPFMQKALSYYHGDALKLPRAGQLLNIGNAYHSLGDYKSAVVSHLEALALFQELKNKRGESFCNQSIGNDFVALGRPREGLPYLERALHQKEEQNDRRGIASAYGGLCLLHKAVSEYDKAISFGLKALAINEELKLTAEIAQGTYEIASLYGQKKDYGQADAYLRKSKMLARQMGDSALSKAVDSERMLIQSGANNQPSLEKNLLSSLETSLASGRKITELSGYEHLIDYYAKKKNFERAFYFQTRLQHVRDSLQGTQVQLQIKNLEEKFTADAKEKEIILLKKDQLLQAAEVKRQKAILYLILASGGLLIVITFLVINRYIVVQRGTRLIEIERMRNGIARDLHDDIGSTLSSINILSKMAMENPMDEILRTRFGKIEDHSRKMMDMMSDIVWSINPVNDTADKTVIRMKEFAAEILEPKNIRYAFHESGVLEEAKMNVNQRKNLFLIFKESMNNAAKYSKCTEITIDLGVQQHKFLLTIRDNGIGFDRQAIRRGNGLTNIEARAALMGSQLKIETSTGNGTQISLSTMIT